MGLNLAYKMLLEYCCFQNIHLITEELKGTIHPLALTRAIEKWNAKDGK